MVNSLDIEKSSYIMTLVVAAHFIQMLRLIDKDGNWTSPRIFQGLRVPQEVIDKACLGGPEEPFFDISRLGISSRTLQLRDVVKGQERFKIGAIEIRAPINYQYLWQPLVASHAFTYHHHIGTATWRIKCQICGKRPSRIRIGHHRRPRFTEYFSRPRTDQLNICLKMIKMTDMPGKIAMARRHLI